MKKYSFYITKKSKTYDNKLLNAFRAISSWPALTSVTGSDGKDSVVTLEVVESVEVSATYHPRSWLLCPQPSRPHLCRGKCGEQLT